MAQVRENLAAGSGSLKQAETENAIDRAIDDMPEDFEIKKFISANRAEVKDMCLTEYNETEAMEMLRQEATLLNIRNLMESTGWTADKIMEMLKIPQGQRSELYMGLSKMHKA